MEVRDLAWDDELADDEFSRVNKQEREALMKSRIYLELESFLGSTAVHQSVVARRPVVMGVEQVLEHMGSRGFRFVRENKALRKHRQRNQRGNRKQPEDHERYVYYRYEDDGTVVLVSDADNGAYLGRFYAPFVTPEVADSIQRIHRVMGQTGT